MKPDHCTGCKSFHNAGHNNPTKEQEKYNHWCCAIGKEATKSVGHCKLHGLKKTPNEEQ